MLHVKVSPTTNEVVSVWDTQPPAGESGWHSAVEVRPEITPHRQGYTAHAFDLTKDPVEIVYGVYDIEVEDRKNGMKANASMGYQRAFQEQMYDPAKYDPTALNAAQDEATQKVGLIELASSHDELDALM